MRRSLLLLLCFATVPIFAQTAAKPATAAPPTATAETTRPTLKPEVVTVTAARTPLALESSASSVVALTQQELQQTPGFTLDDELRQLSGFQLYRRSSSWAANPTSVGVSFRGLGSTAASRTLVLSDQVPLLDPFLAVPHWNEVPALATKQVEAMRGGASDLYGSSAIGGVIQILPVLPTATAYAVDAYGGALGTYALDTLGTFDRDKWSGLAAGDYFHTDGYIPVPVPYRGSADADDNVHSQTGRVEARFAASDSATYFVRGNLLNEARQNGTNLQTNATRLWRYQSGADWQSPQWGHALLRVYGSDEDYRQSFSSVTNNRNTETLTRMERVPAQELGAAAQWAQTYFKTLTLVAGADVHDVRGDDREMPISNGVARPQTSATARQRYIGGYGEAVWLPKNWSITLSMRVDHFADFDAAQYTQNSATVTLEPNIHQLLFDPRLGVVRQITQHVSLTGSAFRAFRGPSLNELYRNGQVGQTSQLANPNLISERATGYEFGALLSAGRFGSVRSSYFWTEVNDPITNLVLSQSGSAITEQRENLGQTRSRGVSAEYDAHPLSWLLLTGGYQYAKATVTQFAPQPALVGTSTPEVPRNSGSASTQAHSTRWGSLALYGYTSGREYDATGNLYELSSYTRFDLEASHDLPHKLDRWNVYASVQNLLNRTIETARTPVLSVGTPQVLVIGVRRLINNKQ